MTPTELAQLGSAAYGQTWQSALAREMRIALRSVQRWAVDGIPKVETANSVRAFLAARARTRIDAPPIGVSDEERDDRAFDECEPHIAALISAGVEAGFHEAEILAAMLSIVTGRMVDGAGIPAAIQTLRQAIDGLKEARDT